MREPCLLSDARVSPSAELTCPAPDIVLTDAQFAAIKLEMERVMRDTRDNWLRAWMSP